MNLNYLDFEQPIADLKDKIEELRHADSDGGMNIADEIKRLETKAQELTVSLYHENIKFDERILELIRPSSESKFLLEIIRLSLNAKPIDKELTSFSLWLRMKINLKE